MLSAQLCGILKPRRRSNAQCLQAEVKHGVIEIKSTLLAGWVINRGIHHQRSGACFFFNSTDCRLLHPRWEILGEFLWPSLSRTSGAAWAAVSSGLQRDKCVKSTAIIQKFNLGSVHFGPGCSLSQFPAGKGQKKTNMSNF